MFEISCRKYVAESNSQIQPYYENIILKLDKNDTALVLIDIWEGQGDLVNRFIDEQILRLVKIARENNILIVHCPSQEYKLLHPSIEIHPNDILITGFDNFDKELGMLGIKNLLYSGYDTFSCVIDKPCGIGNIKLKYGDKYNNILIRDCCISKYEETHLSAISLIEKNFALTTTFKDLNLSNEVSTEYNFKFPNISKKK